MAKVLIFDINGKELQKIQLEANIFNIAVHNQSLFDTVLSERADSRQGTHSTKTRAEVRGGGRKPWRQKGTGRARQGSIRSPQWVGGGVVFGPKPNRNYKLKVNRKVIKLALRSAWTLKAQNNEIVIVDNLIFKNPSTKAFTRLLQNLKIYDQKILFIHNDYDEPIVKSSRNLPIVTNLKVSDLKVENILNCNKVLISKENFEKIKLSLQKKGVRDEQSKILNQEIKPKVTSSKVTASKEKSTKEINSKSKEIDN